MDGSPPDSSVHGIFQEEYWSRLPFPILEDLADPGIELTSLPSLALAGGFFTTSTTGVGGGDICTHMADSLCCTAETETIL